MTLVKRVVFQHEFFVDQLTQERQTDFLSLVDLFQVEQIRVFAHYVWQDITVFALANLVHIELLDDVAHLLFLHLHSFCIHAH